MMADDELELDAMGDRGQDEREVEELRSEEAGGGIITLYHHLRVVTPEHETE
jgi:hypothetical protein